MTDLENKNIPENSDTTSDELIELKKQLATEVVEKLLEKDPNLASSLPKKSMTDYLVDEKTIKDVFHDEIRLWWLWELIWLTIAPVLKKYREMFSKANTKNDLDNLKTTIFNEIWWNLQASTPIQEPGESTWNTKETKESNKKTLNEEKTQEKWWEKQSSGSNDKNKEKKENNQDGLDKEKKTYTNPKSGLTYNLYDQNDPRRWNKKKNGGTTMNQTGCNLTAAAVIHSMIDPSITPDFYRQHYAGRLPYNSIPKASKNKIQSKVLLPGEKNKWPKEKTQQAIEEMIKNLENWYPVDFMVHWPRHGGNNTLTTWQHYMAAVDIRENWGNKEVFIANTHNGKWWGRYPIDKAFASLRQASTYTTA